jgi:hypothetical protein
MMRTQHQDAVKQFDPERETREIVLKRLWHIMLAIAVIAGLFAAFGVIGTIAILMVGSVLVGPVILARPGYKFPAFAWVATLYPLLLVASIYATWFTAWIVLGHQPRMSLDDPKFISPIGDVPLTATYLLMLGAPGAFVLCVLIALAFVAQGVGRDGVHPAKACARLLAPVVSWVSPFLLSSSDLFGFSCIAVWFMD